MLLDERADASGPIRRGFERRLFRLLVDSGLPKPRPQYPVTIGGTPKYIDFAWPAELVAVEAQSFRWHTGEDAAARDRARFAELVALGWHPIPLSWPDVVRRPRWVVHTIRRALALEVRKNPA